MSDLSLFMSDDIKKGNEVKFPASKKLKTKNGKPVDWTLKAVTADVDEAVRKDCTYTAKTNKGGGVPQLDMDKYACSLCVRTIVDPNLNNRELQDFYGAHSANELLMKMLDAGEYTELKAKVMEVNGFDLDFEVLVDDAKN